MSSLGRLFSEQEDAEARLNGSRFLEAMDSDAVYRVQDDETGNRVPVEDPEPQSRRRGSTREPEPRSKRSSDRHHTVLPVAIMSFSIGALLLAVLFRVMGLGYQSSESSLIPKQAPTPSTVTSTYVEPAKPAITKTQVNEKHIITQMPGVDKCYAINSENRIKFQIQCPSNVESQGQTPSQQQSQVPTQMPTQAPSQVPTQQTQASSLTTAPTSP